ncbi:MAG: pyruvate ferredoxin oxidoreductase, partial [Syntrophobacterales bacterium]|nr:pyruvate ferredoxin oxidoreductase [Syntrophobacterales bacterium]
MEGYHIITGNQAAAIGAKLCRVQVIAAYPITPQSKIPEVLAEYVEKGELKAEFIRVESEHSALTVCISASLVGARAFTATAAQGLAYMHEQLHWAAGARVPIVMPVANRGLGAPWTILNDMQDSLSQRDTGWIQLYCMNNQEVLDHVIMGYRIAEEVLLPVMVCFDGFRLSHTVMPVDVPSQELVDQYLPPRRPSYFLDPDSPVNINPVVMGDLIPGVDGSLWPDYMSIRRKMQKAHEKALDVIVEAGKAFGELFGRDYDWVLRRYRTEDATVLFLTMGSLTSETMEAVDLLRREGIKIGVIGLRVFRPFPAKELVETLSVAERVIVVEKAISYGYETPLATETKAALYSLGLSLIHISEPTRP